MHISPKILTGNVVIWRNGQSESIYYSSLHGLQAQLLFLRVTSSLVVSTLFNSMKTHSAMTSLWRSKMQPNRSGQSFNDHINLSAGVEKKHNQTKAVCVLLVFALQELLSQIHF